jgi:uncharacterized protein
MSRTVEVAFASGAERCVGWLHLPDHDGPHPCVVMLHSTAGVRQMTCYARRGEAFAEAGVATLNFDCRGFGESAGEPRLLLDVRRQAQDLEAAIGFARDRAEVDPGRLALWGASASCGPVLAAASREDVAAVVCLTPFIPGRETQRSAGIPFGRLALAAFADRLRVISGREPHGVAVGGEPGETAILVREDAAARERAMVPPGVGWENRVVLRPRLRTPSPLRIAPSVKAPVLVVAGERDPLCPPGPATKLAERAGAGRLALLPQGHFDLYEGASAEVEADFLAAATAG